MADAILVLNAGSSSLKFAAFERLAELPVLMRGSLTSLQSKPRMSVSSAEDEQTTQTDFADRPIGTEEALELILTELDRCGLLQSVSAVGHRIVHGGRDFTAATILDPPTLEALRALAPLAPLHQPDNLEIVELARRLLPKAAQIGCFDTAFHADRPRLATLYALPRALTESGITSFGFHGISYGHIASQLRERYGPTAGGRAVVAHLGSGASLCAMREGKSVATTMGFSPLDGLVMSTRSGSLDPGVILYLLQDRKMSADEISRLLYDRSGLLGVSGISGDMQRLLDLDDPHAAEAVDLFVYRAGREIGSLAAALGGLDTLVFTAGIGENSPLIREKICEAAAWLGVTIDAERNREGDERIGASGSAVDVLVIPTDEERAVAAQMLSVAPLEAIPRQRNERNPAQ
ncbi:MAG: acetate/propionate family kinase [Mesorhizobium sp.]|uniref:acetate/propionate family kinase n=1 Tax=unclassified Mesorhizobium TaxID=325217 RepID=UPI000FE62EFA|nr:MULTISPECIES: acetate/propionate family kinase [unclassified Mesorhizobium]RWB32420.1 MAG: acetate/propionate family kinase [Mesorhizobium sp.]RWB80781.1 MAG: acetate/propionate family kinase [Mesorhizobium sp.]RWC08372.1 MAG: acetate/propionate family kinase [Mesorhizobium sp.]RWD22401.1 MAG: acetate/propionate family kinase [Mesorhizobium sp.]TGT99046.1 acetate/propionate family kinase [Mesorhizobium sp. M5C.F.Ca.ET.164.01.1.1]